MNYYIIIFNLLIYLIVNGHSIDSIISQDIDNIIAAKNKTTESFKNAFNNINNNKKKKCFDESIEKLEDITGEAKIYYETCEMSKKIELEKHSNIQTKEKIKIQARTNVLYNDY
ncbi:uncharacterized protein LOC122849383 [Aphidius gifuensis]|uniref:uncharacterized protein LOC122849383 n=1 Tax=Aphidius gifuensis TaxID=684658 RepID=UPI001CDB7D05|nr:uncharacterized protein LOC122849383 [Aphidius gifuensis]